jgi:hypothetical protein
MIRQEARACLDPRLSRCFPSFSWPEEPSALTVIRLKHAKAQELADTLSGILPPGTTLVADPRTNSLINTPSSPPAKPTAPE